MNFKKNISNVARKLVSGQNTQDLGSQVMHLGFCLSQEGSHWRSETGMTCSDLHQENKLGSVCCSHGDILEMTKLSVLGGDERRIKADGSGQVKSRFRTVL